MPVKSDGPFFAASVPGRPAQDLGERAVELAIDG
jgi:hypothetical protein